MASSIARRVVSMIRDRVGLRRTTTQRIGEKSRGASIDKLHLARSELCVGTALQARLTGSPLDTTHIGDMGGALDFLLFGENEGDDCSLSKHANRTVLGSEWEAIGSSAALLGPFEGRSATDVNSMPLKRVSASVVHLASRSGAKPKQAQLHWLAREVNKFESTANSQITHSEAPATNAANVRCLSMPWLLHKSQLATSVAATKRNLAFGNCVEKDIWNSRKGSLCLKTGSHFEFVLAGAWMLC